MFDPVVKFIREQFNTDDFIPLHEPRFYGNEKKYLNECIDSTFVSSVGKFVDLFEEKIAKFTGAKHAIAVVNGTAALHVGLELAGVKRGDEVITQALTFIATCNAISYCGAKPVFVDVDRKTLGLSASALAYFLENKTAMKNGLCINNSSGKTISAVVPMHTFGNPCEIEEIAEICNKYNIALIEDAAESLGSYVNNTHTGLFGLMGTLSFNGNKTITTGGGGMIITNDDIIAKKAKHITTTAKQAHPYKFIHDMIGYNYRMPNINAALGCAQIENLKTMLNNKEQLTQSYKEFFSQQGIEFVTKSNNTVSNNWLNAIILKDLEEQRTFLKFTNDKGVMTRPIWEIMPKLEMFKDCQSDDLKNTLWLVDRVVNIPSSVRL
jgi:perosamine synthetase